MSHYQQQYYAAPPPPAVPIQSSFYAARQRFEQQPQATSTPPHLRSSAHDYRQHPAPPRHPLQQERVGGQQPQPGPSQGQPQPQNQQVAHPQSQYGQVQQYQPPYAQTQTQVGRRPAPYVPPGQYAPQSEFTPAQYAQRMYAYAPMQMQPQLRAQPTPAQALAMYEAYNARTQRAPAPQQQQQPPPPQTQHGRAVGAPQVAPSMSAPPGSPSHSQPPENNPAIGSRRPLPQPAQGGPQAHPRPMSMPPQTRYQGSASPLNGFGHSSSSSSSLSRIVPQSSVRPTSSLPSPSSSSSSAPISPSQGLPRTTNMHFAQTSSPEKVLSSEETTAQRTPTQRRALPHSPTAPPDLTQLQHRRSGMSIVPAPHPPAKSVMSLPAPPQTIPQAPAPQPCLSSDSEDGDDRLSAVRQESNETRGRTPSPQYGILDLPKRNSQAFGVKPEPPSPQYGIRDLPSRTKSAVDRRRAWELAEQGMNEAQAHSKPTSPTKPPASAPVLAALPAAPVALARSPQPQLPQQAQKLPMPVVRQPQPSRTERTPSWTLPTANLEKIAAGGEPKTSMVLRFATMALDEENVAASKTKTEVVVPQIQSQRPTAQGNSASRSGSPTKPYPFSTRSPRRSVNMDLSLDDAPPPSLRRSPSPSVSTASSSVPSIPTIKTPEDIPQHSPAQNGVPTIPQINLPGDLDLDDALNSAPNVKVQAPTGVVSPKPTSPHKATIPLISIPGDEEDTGSSRPMISVSAASPQAHAVSMPVILDDLASAASPAKSRGLPRPPNGAAAAPIPTSSSSGSNLRSRGGGLVCGGCHQSIVGRIVSAMGLRWHPQCFKCCTCGEHLEHVSSYEHDGKPYCHLDYHELFAPQCYTCKTPIIDERFITLDDPALGKRTYHEQHFFCAECGDPFLAPSPAKASTRSGPNEISIKGDGAFDIALDADGDEVGFTVFRGHPYCEACHVRLRAPKCKACKRSIRDGMRAVEALGGKWCYECFVCAGCQKPFEEPSFFQRDKKPFCEHCFSVILRNEL